jgi:putative transposase
MDFFTVPTLTGRVLFVLVLLHHHRRRIVHLAITEHPTTAWTAQQVVDAFPYDTAPRWLVRDRDAIYGDAFRRRVAGMAMTEVITAPSSPWQNPFAERLIGSLRRECLDHIIILSQSHLRRVLARYVAYYHGARTHLALEKTRRRPDAFKRRLKGRSWHSPKWVACTIGTSAAPLEALRRLPPHLQALAGEVPAHA